MEIPRSLLDAQNDLLSKLDKSAKEEYLKLIKDVDFSNIAQAREDVIEILDRLTELYGLDAGTIAARYYDMFRAIETGQVLGANAVSAADSVSNRELVQAAIQSVVDTGQTAYFNSKVVNQVSKVIRQSAGDTVYRNGARDPLKPRYARVPSGFETCEFCMMLASRGFIYLSAKTASNINDHYHANCRCTIVPQFVKNATVEGYDEDAIYDQWKDMVKAREERKAEREARKNK